MSSIDEDDEVELQALLLEGRALQAVTELEGSNEDSSSSVDAARASYERLHDAAQRSLADAAALQAELATLQAQLERQLLLQEVAALSEAEGLSDPVQLVDHYREQRGRAAAEAAAQRDREEDASRQAAALRQKLDELGGRMEDEQDERRAELAPQILAAREDAQQLSSVVENERAKASAAQREVAELAARLDSLQMDVMGLAVLAGEEREELARAERAPGAARHAADMAAAVLRGLRDEDIESSGRLREQEVALAAAEAAAQEVVQAQLAAAKAGAKLQGQIGGRERGVEEVVKDIEMAKLEREKLLAEQVTLDVEVERKKAEAKHAAAAARSEARGRDTLLRRHNHAQTEGEALAEAVPPLENAVVNARSQLASLQKAGGREAKASMEMQQEVLAAVERVAEEKKLTELQAALVKASLAGLRALDEECAAARAAAAQREVLIREVAAQRDAAARFAAQRTARLREAVEAAEMREREGQELQRRRGEARGARAELRGLCELMAGQGGRLQLLLAATRKAAVDLGDQVTATEGQVRQLEAVAQGRSTELKRATRERLAAEAAKVLAGNQLAMARRAGVAGAEAADDVALDAARLAQQAAEATAGLEGLRRAKAGAAAAKQAAQRTLLERSDEVCALYEQSMGLEAALREGTRALARCEDEVRTLGLEMAELQRRLYATHKTAPDVPRYDRGIVRLKAELLKARREVEELGAALESPKAAGERLRLLPGKVPNAAELQGRIAQLEERLEARCSQAAQKDGILAELAALADALVEQARASHGGAYDISVRLADSQAALAKLTRRMMAAVSELSLYSAMALKLGGQRGERERELAAARAAVAEGKPPTPEADREFERLQREECQRTEVRAQAAELRCLKEQGLLGQGTAGPSPRPQAYISEAQGVPVPFLGAFPPFKPTDGWLRSPSPSRGGSGAGKRRGSAGGSSMPSSPQPSRGLCVVGAA